MNQITRNSIPPWQTYRMINNSTQSYLCKFISVKLPVSPLLNPSCPDYWIVTLHTENEYPLRVITIIENNLLLLFWVKKLSFGVFWTTWETKYSIDGQSHWTLCRTCCRSSSPVAATMFYQWNDCFLNLETIWRITKTIQEMQNYLSHFYRFKCGQKW